MSARKAPTINEVRADGTVVLTPNGSTEPRTYNLHRSHFDKGTWIKIGSFLGVRWNGVPMHKELDEIKSLVLAKFNGTPYTHNKPEPTVTVTPTHTPKEPIMDTSVEKALKILMETLGAGVSEDKVREIVARETLPIGKALADLSEQVRNTSPTQLVINGVALKPTTGVVHRKYAKVAAAMSLRDNVYLVGPAGTGKTTLPEQIADAMGLRFVGMSCGVTDQKHDYAGYKDGNGTYNPTIFRDYWQNGGVVLLDEFDNSSPELPIVLNAALANGFFTFPDGERVRKHADTIVCVAANTYGTGATAQYVGRSPIDAATLDRFSFIEIELDEAVEDAMVASVACDASLAKEWVRVVRTARKNVEKHGLRVMVTPRATVGGLKLLATGAFTMQEAFAARVAKGLDTQQLEKISAGITFG